MHIFIGFRFSLKHFYNCLSELLNTFNNTELDSLMKQMNNIFKQYKLSITHNDSEKIQILKFFYFVIFESEYNLLYIFKQEPFHLIFQKIIFQFDYCSETRNLWMIEMNHEDIVKFNQVIQKRLDYQESINVDIDLTTLVQVQEYYTQKSNVLKIFKIANQIPQIHLVNIHQ